MAHYVLFLAFRFLWPTQLTCDPKDAHKAVVDIPTEDDGTDFVIRRVQFSSPHRFCLAINETIPPETRPLSVGCYPPGDYTVAFNSGESCIHGAAGRRYAITAMRSDPILPNAPDPPPPVYVFVRASVETKRKKP